VIARGERPESRSGDHSPGFSFQVQSGDSKCLL
jgi:hypothetical protein